MSHITDIERLVGKKLTEGCTDENSFSVTDLPKPYRIIKPGEAIRLDLQRGRLNLYLNADNVVQLVKYG